MGRVAWAISLIKKEIKNAGWVRSPHQPAAVFIVYFTLSGIISPVLSCSPFPSFQRLLCLHCLSFLCHFLSLSMVRFSWLYYSERHLSGSVRRGFFFLPRALALLTSFFILFYVYYTSDLLIHHHQPLARFNSPSTASSAILSHSAPHFMPIPNEFPSFDSTKNQTFQEPDSNADSESQRRPISQSTSNGT